MKNSIKCPFAQCKAASGERNGETMRRIIVLIILVAICGFLNFFNSNKIVSYTRRLSNVEKTFNAEKNINTELLGGPLMICAAVTISRLW